MKTASPDSKNAPDTAPEDMIPPLPNLLLLLPSWLRSVKRVDCAWVEERLAAYGGWNLPEGEFEAVGENHVEKSCDCFATKRKDCPSFSLPKEVMK